MALGWLGTHPRDPDHFAWIVGNTTFGGTFTSRLMQEIRAKRGWSYGVSSRVGFDRHRDAFVVWSAPSAKDAPACLELEIELLEALRAKGLTSEELAFTKNYLARSYAFEIDTARKRVHQRLEEALYDLPEGYHARYLERLGQLSLDEVNSALKQRTPVEDLIVAVVATDADTGALLEKAAGGRPRQVVAYDCE
jgi:zinc protease